MTLWAGQSVGLCHHADAAELMTELIAALDDIRKSEFEELGKQSETGSRQAMSFHGEENPRPGGHPPWRFYRNAT